MNCPLREIERLRLSEAGHPVLFSTGYCASPARSGMPEWLHEVTSDNHQTTKRQAAPAARDVTYSYSTNQGTNEHEANGAYVISLSDSCVSLISFLARTRDHEDSGNSEIQSTKRCPRFAALSPSQVALSRLSLGLASHPGSPIRRRLEHGGGHQCID